MHKSELEKLVGQNISFKLDHDGTIYTAKLVSVSDHTAHFEYDILGAKANMMIDLAKIAIVYLYDSAASMPAQPYPYQPYAPYPIYPTPIVPSPDITPWWPYSPTVYGTASDNPDVVKQTTTDGVWQKY